MFIYYSVPKDLSREEENKIKKQIDLTGIQGFRTVNAGHIAEARIIL